VDLGDILSRMGTGSWWAKLERAREHIVQFAEAAAECVQVRPDDMTMEGDTNVGDGVFVTQSVTITTRPIPDRLSAIAGDAFHNLRAALDHIAVALTHNDRAAFVIVSSQSDGRLRELERFLEAVPREARALISRVQPYRAEDPETQPPAILQQLDNLDKHRSLVLVAAYFRTESAEPLESPEARVHAVRLGSGIGGAGLQELFSLDLTIPQGASLSVAFTIRGELTFGAEGPLRGKSVVDTFQGLYRFTSSLLSDLEKSVA